MTTEWQGLPPRTLRAWSDPLAAVGVVTMEGPGHLVFYPREAIVSLREEHFGRVEILAASGEVGHHPGPLSRLQGSPFTSAGPGGLVNPHPRLQPDSDVLYLRTEVRDTIQVTDAGEFRLRGPARQHAARLPGALRFGHVYLNPRRLRRLVMRSDSGAEAHLDQGTVLTARPMGARSVMRALDVDTLRWLPAANQGQSHLSAARLRNWPLEIATAPADWLQAEFRDDPERLIANLAWQSVVTRRSYAESHRSLFYTTILPLLEAAQAPLLLGVPESEREYLRYCNVLLDLVMERRLFRFSDLGFRDQRPDLRGVGDSLPHVVLFVEKATRERDIAAIRKAFGCSFVIGGGRSLVVGTEFLADLLLPVLQGRPVHVLALVDFDPWGWIATDAFVRQLARYGVATSALRHLVVPRRFTPRELRERCVPLPQPDATQRTNVRQWTERSGGVDGRPLGLGADNLTGDRLLQAVREELPDM